jgi:hypothetical protein
MWFLILKEEEKLQVFESRVIRKIFGSKKDEVSWQFRILHNKELHDLCRPFSIVRVVKYSSSWARHVVWMGETRNT